jgi:hypothetical protein
MTDVLLQHPWLSPAALAVIIVIGPIIGRSLVSRPRLSRALTGLALVPVAVLTLLPVDRVVFERCAVQWALPTPGRVELMANVVLFVAPVLLAGVTTRRPVLAMVAGSVLSGGLEALQALVPAIGRSCDTGDWLSNTVGAVIGGALAWVALAPPRRRRRL